MSSLPSLSGATTATRASGTASEGPAASHAEARFADTVCVRSAFDAYATTSPYDGDSESPALLKAALGMLTIRVSLSIVYTRAWVYGSVPVLWEASAASLTSSGSGSGTSFSTSAAASSSLPYPPESQS